MDDRRRTLAAITFLLGLFLLIALLVGAFISGKKVLSPVPEDGAIKIIFVTPTSVPLVLPSVTPGPTGKNTP